MRARTIGLIVLCVMGSYSRVAAQTIGIAPATTSIGSEAQLNVMVSGLNSPLSGLSAGIELPEFVRIVDVSPGDASPPAAVADFFQAASTRQGRFVIYSGVGGSSQEGVLARLRCKVEAGAQLGVFPLEFITNTVALGNEDGTESFAPSLTDGILTITSGGGGEGPFTLATSSNPSNGGAISASPTPGSDGRYPSGVVVTLTANPNTDFNFGSWTGVDSSNANVATVTMNANRSVTGNFTPNNQPRTLLLTATPSNGGSIVPTPAPGSDGKYPNGTVVTLTATPNTDFNFASWIGVDASNGNSATLTLTSDRSVTASFGRPGQSRTLVLTSNPADGGTVTASPAPGSDAKYPDGTVVTLTATPTADFKFVSWSGVDASSGGTATVTMNRDRSVTGNFEKKISRTLTLTSTPSDGGSIAATPAPSADGRYADGTIVTLTALPVADFDFVSWSGVDSSIANTATVTMNQDRTVICNFAKSGQSRTLTLISNPEEGGSISVTAAPDGDGTYADGTVVTLTASPASDHIFNSWSGADTTSENTATVTLNTNRTVTANFSVAPGGCAGCSGQAKSIREAVKYYMGDFMLFGASMILLFLGRRWGTWAGLNR